MSTFDAKAATWDADPHRRRLAQEVVDGIVALVPWRAGLRLLDVGCGTGLVGLPLAASAASVLGVDLSAGMVERFTAKASAAGLVQVRGEVRDLIAAPLPAASIDLAVSAMAFHHIPDTAAMLGAIVAALAPGGWVAIADLEREDGSFHDEAVPHLGFEPGILAGLMTAAGLEQVRTQRVHVMVRPDRPRTYPVFLAVGRRP
jgi:2-polyprenyl-3-methyl-5-hydroxy-6-metoxy-1,4-benzoquinol methylase